MAKRIKITAGEVEAYAQLNDTETARRIWDALPLEARGQRWGEEIYFGIPVDCGSERPQETVEAGDLGYWEPGSAFCIFFGPTPISGPGEIRPADPVTVFGRIEGDPKVFSSVPSATRVVVERAE